MYSSWMGLVSVERRKISYATIAVLVNTLRANEKESRVFDTLLSLSLGRGRGQGQGESRHPDPTPRPGPTDPTPRPDHPTPRHPKAGAGDASGCKPMQGGASRCKGMQADASDKARRQGEGGRGKGQGGRCPRQRAQKEKALAVSAWSHVVACVLAPRLFCAFGSVAPPCPFDPSPLPLPPLL